MAGNLSDDQCGEKNECHNEVLPANCNYYFAEDIDTLAALLDLEEDEGNSSKGNEVAAAKQSSDTDAESLKKKLEAMEKEMATLKAELKKKNSLPAALKDVGLDFSSPASAAAAPRSDPLPSSSSEVHQGESCSSDDEENPTARKYNEFGQFVRQRLAHQGPAVDRLAGKNCPQGWKNKSSALTNLSSPATAASSKAEAGNGYSDPFFGIKILNPLISSTTLHQRMEGRKQIKLSQIRGHMRGEEIDPKQFVGIIHEDQNICPGCRW